MLIAFQTFERPGVENQIRLVVARCAWLVIFDGGSAPLQETRQHPTRTAVMNAAADVIRKKVGGAIAVHGLFDVPLMPWIFEAGETQLSRSIIAAWITFLQKAMDPNAGILAWIDDCTERSFNQSTKAPSQLASAKPGSLAWGANSDAWRVRIDAGDTACMPVQLPRADYSY